MCFEKSKIFHKYILQLDANNSVIYPDNKLKGKVQEKAEIFRVLFGKAFEKHPLMSMTSDIQHLNS